MSDSETSGPRRDAVDGRQQMSAWMDGDAQCHADAAMAAWRGDVQAREAWHAYHLIGDVLRSEELARAPRHDEAFLQRLRLRMETEPVPLAPGAIDGAASRAIPPLPARTTGATVPRSASRWWAPAAVAAGFMAVAGLYVMQQQAEAPVEAPLAGFGGGFSAVGQPGAISFAPPLREQPRLVSAPVSATLIRDARLDRYLESHRRMSGSGLGPMPGAALRAVDTVAAEER